jgi:hypothetical protein
LEQAFSLLLTLELDLWYRILFWKHECWLLLSGEPLCFVIWELPCSSLSLKSDYLDWSLTWLSSAPPAKYGDSASNRPQPFLPPPL